ncbi:hypothetical protein HDU67_009499, partial [Dinochytrium kinnereticum]
MDALSSAAVKAAWNAGGDEDVKRTHGIDMTRIPPVTATNTGAARPRSTSTSQPRKHSFSSSLFAGDWIAQSRIGSLAPAAHPSLVESNTNATLNVDGGDSLSLGMSSLGLGLEQESAWARLHRSKSVDFRNSKPILGGPSLSHAMSMEELLVDRMNHLPTPRDLSRTNSPWTSPRMGPGPVAKPLRSPFISPILSPRREADLAMAAAHAADMSREMLDLPPSVMEPSSSLIGHHRLSTALPNVDVDGSGSGDDTDATLNSPTRSTPMEVVSPTLSTISIPLSALSQSTLSSLPPAVTTPPPVVIAYPTAEQIAHPDRNFSELDGLISDIVKRMLYRDESSGLGASGSACAAHKVQRATTPATTPTPSSHPLSKSKKSTRNTSLSSTTSTLINLQQQPPAAQPLPPADHAHITLNVAGAVPYHHHASYYGAPPPEPLQLSLRVVADRVETVNRLGQVKSRIEFRR